MGKASIEDGKRKEIVLTLLANTYPNAKTVLRYKTPWEFLVCVILSAQCTDAIVNKVTEKLFVKYPSLDDYVTADREIFEQDIRSTGFYRNKTKNILATAKMVKEQFGGKVPATMEEMMTLPGVARKTANVVLGRIYNIVEGIAVDTHVSRLSQRLRLVDLTKIGGKKLMVFEKEGNIMIDYTKDAHPNKIENELKEVVPTGDWPSFTNRLIDHGRAVCKAQNPDCNRCVLEAFCPVSRI